MTKNSRWVPPSYVNLHGQKIDPRRLAKAAAAALAPAPASTAAATPALSAAEIETVYDELCLAGCARGKTWLLQFLRHRECKTERDTCFTVAEIDAAMRALRAQGRVVESQGSGHDIAAAERLQHLPRLLAAPGALDAWKAWARAGASYGQHQSDPPPPALRSRAECVAFARLVLYGGLSAEAFRRLSLRGMGAASGLEFMAEALNSPLIAGLLERMDADLRDSLLMQCAQSFNLDTPSWQPLRHWLDERVMQPGRGVPAMLRLLVAEQRLHRGDLPGHEAALAGMSGVGIDLHRAARQTWAGQWAEAALSFGAALKQAHKELKVRRGVAPFSLMQWYLLSLLAQHDAAAWTLARKFCIAESGSRDPAIHGGWGLWVHVIASRLGDGTLQADLLAWPRADYLQHQSDENANRLILAAWLGHPPAGWNAKAVAMTLQGLLAAGQSWKADVLRQACERLELPLPARDGDEPAPWAPRIFGSPQEAWRDALAAIEALGTLSASASQAATELLHWRIELDDEARVAAVQAFERPLGPRGPGKAREVSLAKLKKSTRLDPRDAAVARCIGTARYSSAKAVLDVTGAAIALVGHPSVAFSDAPELNIDLREGLPLLEVRRQRQSDGTEVFVFALDDPLLSREPADVDWDDIGDDPATERQRRDSLRILRDGADRARLVRVTPAQRRVAELVAKRWSVPVAAQAELDGALRVLAGHFQLHSDAQAGQPVPSEPRLRAQFSPAGDSLQLRLLAQPFGSYGPTVLPGAGRARLITLHQGLNLSTERDLAREAGHLAEVLEALPFLAGNESGDAGWRLDDPEQALAALERLPGLAAIAGIDWPRGKPVRVLPVAAAALQVKVSSGADWFAVDGELRIDEQRVLGLQRLMQLARESTRGRFIALGEGEYLALTEQLRRQLADLAALGQIDKTGLKLPAAAAAWLAETLDDNALTGDKPWQQRLHRLAEAAELNPEPPPALAAQLRPYQIEGYAWMARLAHAGLGACLADDMGLGKTVQTLALLLQRAAIGPALVIAPPSVCGNWVAEAARFAPTLRVLPYGEGDRRELLRSSGPGDLVIVSYALAQIDVEAFAETEWATLVMDEAQALKNAATKRARSVAQLRAGFRVALSGTPVENRLADLWSVMNLLNPGLLGSHNQFGERFANPIERERDDTARLRLRRLVAPFLLRRTKAQVLTDLPPRTEIIHRVEPGPEERSFLEASRRDALERLATVSAEVGAGQAAFHVLAELTRLRRAACDPRLVAPEFGLIGAKVHEFEQLAGELVAGRHKALVFSQFTDFLALLVERLNAAGIAHQYLDGSTPAAERTRRVAAFQRGEGELFLISLKAGGYGLNLTAADYVIITDPWWNPAAEDQAMGRAHRIGQQRPVTVYRLVTAGSIEERIVLLHHDKRSLADGILEGQDSSAVPRADELLSLLGPA